MIVRIIRYVVPFTALAACSEPLATRDDPQDTAITDDGRVDPTDATDDEPLMDDTSPATEEPATEAPADPPEVLPDDPPPEDVPSVLPCPTFDEPVAVGELVDDAITEASGLVASRAHPGIWWTHNDSGDGPRLFAMDAAGAPRAVVDLSGHARAVDWEDLAIGPGPDGTDWLYIADIGDNAEARGNVVVYALPEPDPDGDLDAAIARTVTLTYTYPDGPHNAETLLVDPRDGSLRIVTKSGDGVSRVYADPRPDMPGSKTLEQEGSLAFGGDALPGDTLATGGDIAPDGSGVVLRTYDSAFYWRVAEAETVDEALAGEPCTIPLASEPQGEAIAFTADGEGYVTVSEGAGATLWFASRI